MIFYILKHYLFKLLQLLLFVDFKFKQLLVYIINIKH